VFRPLGQGGEDPCFGAAERRRAERACFGRAADFLPDVFFSNWGAPICAAAWGGNTGDDDIPSKILPAPTAHMLGQAMVGASPKLGRTNIL
jgi:hypothetical protein